MLEKQDLIEIEGWERDHYGDYICEWKYELDDGEADDKYEAFVLTVQEQEPDDYRVSIAVSFHGSSVGDLLSADYSESFETVDKAMGGARIMVNRLTEEYDLDN